MVILAPLYYSMVGLLCRKFSGWVSVEAVGYEKLHDFVFVLFSSLMLEGVLYAEKSNFRGSGNRFKGFGIG